VAKHRNGALDKVRLRFIGEYARFDNLESYNEEAVPAHTNMGANTDFDAPAPASYTVPSKMNSIKDDFQNFDIAETNYDAKQSEVMFQTPEAIYQKAKDERVEVKIAKTNLEIAEKQCAAGKIRASKHRLA
jgi:hypothetical protein